ncbi:hypothetical protein RMR16_006310 [Agrobacterium sp. rho-13.3]|uniref:hypothetical protein n=1 Tax=Agrobacterium sp. rho-13.3 TaxID=3072980 RepID=UPI002A1055FC|nr:hypothetical protein [Agrobacterium sp. rho-13.3]MDX8311329.1 hypothetical protein [Agrobacterium sp. rho-13.3]
MINGEELKIVGPDRLLRKPIKDLMPLLRKEMIEAGHQGWNDDGDDPSVVAGPKHPSQGGCYLKFRKQDIRTCRGKTEDHQQSEQQL